jgi:hypothetical protein
MRKIASVGDIGFMVVILLPPAVPPTRHALYVRIAERGVGHT